MKQWFLKVSVLFICLFSTSLFASNYYPPFLTGVYLLEGSNPNSSRINYYGEVEIRPNGNTFIVTWYVGSVQTQTGIGVLRDGVLSVAFYDYSKLQSGVVSFSMRDSYSLEGVWAVYPSTSVGKEWLTYIHS